MPELLALLDLGSNAARFALARINTRRAARGRSAAGRTGARTADVEGAAAADATVLRPVKDEFYGDRTGHKWQLATPVEDVSPAEMQRPLSATLA